MNHSDNSKKIYIKCPTCQKEFFYFDSEFRPFCSDKCKLIDLGKWFNESYKVPGQNATPPGEEREGDQEQVQDQDQEHN